MHVQLLAELRELQQQVGQQAEQAGMREAELRHRGRGRAGDGATRKVLMEAQLCMLFMLRVRATIGEQRWRCL